MVKHKGVFHSRRATFIDNGFVEELFGEKKVLKSLLKEWTGQKLPIEKTRMGYALGDDSFIEAAIRRFDRRKRRSKSKRMRTEEHDFPPVDKLIRDFEKRRQVRIEKIDPETRVGRRLREELMIMLKDKAGLTYSRIAEYAPFQSLKYSTLGKLYIRAKGRGYKK